MRIKLKKEEVELEGIAYEVSGAYDPDQEDVYDMQVFARGGDQPIQEHLKEGVVSDLADEIHRRLSFRSGAEEYFDDCDSDCEDVEEEEDEC